MNARRAFRSFSGGLGHRLYAASGPALKILCLTSTGRAAVEVFMRAGGRALLWAFDARKQPSPAAAQREWQRILVGIGLDPQTDGGDRANACATCFSRCTLKLKPGNARTCDTVMSINDEMLTRLGGRMVISERLTDPGATRCVVRVAEPPQVRGNRGRPWPRSAASAAH
jgi:hypothetical protein